MIIARWCKISVEEAAEFYDENDEEQTNQSNNDMDESEDEEGDEFQSRNIVWEMLG